MSLRVFLGVLLSTIFVLSLAFIAVSFSLLREQLLPLFPEELIGANSAVRMLIFQYAIASVVTAVLLLAGLFYVIGKYVGRPLRATTEAMEVFAETGKRIPLGELPGAPLEIKKLADTFEHVADKVAEAHAHDMEVSRVKSDFITTAAHQLRTPLTGIRWALEALEKTSITPEQKALVESATQKSRELVSIVGTLLDISSIESGKYKYDFQPVDMGGLIDEVTRDFSPLSSARSVSLYYAKGEEAIPPARADRERIKWVLNNLVENAIRYTPAGGTVKVTVEKGLGRLFIRVHDTGIGIEQKDRANIFERFYRTSNGIAKENSGNGLGLYIARTIATDHGGDLNFEGNTDGPGTTFTLSLPVSR